MECRHVVIVGQALLGGCERIAAEFLSRVAAGFQQDDAIAGLGQARGHRAAAGARADHDVVAVPLFRRSAVLGHSVSRNSMSARFSVSLSGFSSGNRSVPK